MKPKLTKGEKAYMQLPMSVKSIDKVNSTLTMVASTQDVDRHGDTVIQSGWNLEEFMKNPVILNSHRYDDATEVIANAIRSEIVGKGKRSRLEQDWKFAVDENPKAKIIFDLYANDFLHASSVGFIPRKFAENADGTRNWYVIEEAELLEVSAVSVPANARALAKAKGIDIDVLPSDEENPADDEADDISEDEEVPPADEQPAPENDEGGEEEKGTDDTKADAAGGEGDDEVPAEVPAEEVEVIEPEPAPVVASYKIRVLGAIERIESRETRKLRKVANIINSLLEGDPELKRLDAKVRVQVRKRKIHQVIRTLMQTR